MCLYVTARYMTISVFTNEFNYQEYSLDIHYHTLVYYHCLFTSADQDHSVHAPIYLPDEQHTFES